MHDGSLTEMTLVKIGESVILKQAQMMYSPFSGVAPCQKIPTERGYFLWISNLSRQCD